MAQIRLSRQDAESSNLPPVCMRCGAPATLLNPVKFSWMKSTARVATAYFGLLGLAARAATWNMTVVMPLCDAHRSQWPSVTWTGVRATEITDDSITLTNVSEWFVQALESRPRASKSAGGALQAPPDYRVPHAAPLIQMVDTYSQSSAAPPGMPSGPGLPHSAPRSSNAWLWILGVFVLGPVLCGGLCMATTLLPLWLMPQPQPVQPAQPPFGPIGIDFGNQQQMEEQRQRIEEQMRRQQEQMQHHQEEFRRQMEQNQPPLPGQFPGQ